MLQDMSMWSRFDEHAASASVISSVLVHDLKGAATTLHKQHALLVAGADVALAPRA
jgi:hypothetical protein